VIGKVVNICKSAGWLKLCSAICSGRILLQCNGARSRSSLCKGKPPFKQSRNDHHQFTILNIALCIHKSRPTEVFAGHPKAENGSRVPSPQQQVSLAQRRITIRLIQFRIPKRTGKPNCAVLFRPFGGQGTGDNNALVNGPGSGGTGLQR
jgi:hypothetical protein